MMMIFIATGVVVIEDYLYKEEKEGGYPDDEVVDQVW